MAAAARNALQVCANACNEVPTTNIGDVGNALFAIKSQVRRTGAYGVGNRDSSGNATDWNFQKAAATRTAAYRGNLAKYGMPICLTSVAAVDGFTKDDQSTSADWNDNIQDRSSWQINPNFMGMKWAVLTDYPEQADGSPGGLARETNRCQFGFDLHRKVVRFSGRSVVPRLPDGVPQAHLQDLVPTGEAASPRHL